MGYDQLQVEPNFADVCLMKRPKIRPFYDTIFGEKKIGCFFFLWKKRWERLIKFFWNFFSGAFRLTGKGNFSLLLIKWHLFPTLIKVTFNGNDRVVGHLVIYNETRRAM